MRKKIVCAGFGGQGIMVMGKLLAQAAMKESRQVTWMPSYGAEVRGGTAHSMVVISDTEIALGVVFKPNDCIVMNQPSFLKFKELIEKDGIIIVNSSLVQDDLKRKDLRFVKVPATQRAKALGNVKVANMIALGAYIELSRLVSLKGIIEALEVVIPPHHRDLIKLNISALKEGARLAHECKS